MSKLGLKSFFKKCPVIFLRRVPMLKMVQRSLKICIFAGAFMEIFRLILDMFAIFRSILP